MRFDWDDDKEKVNIEKHGLDFSTAALVFDDYERIEKFDDIHSIDEDRYVTIGQIKEVLVIVVVVYTPRNPNIIRIISARVATKKEQEAYYGKKH